jgi:hypothetical protein
MLGVTAFGLLLTPVFYYVIEQWLKRHKPTQQKAQLEPRQEVANIAVVEPAPGS